MLLPKACHDQMIFDDKCNDLAAFTVNLHSFQERFGDAYTALGVVFDSPRFTYVMQQQNEIKQCRICCVMKLVAVFYSDGLRDAENLVQLSDCVQRVDVGGVAMVVFVLHQTGQPIEFRYESSQYTQFMHQL